MNNQYAVKIWSYDRLQKKTFMSLPFLNNIVGKANERGLVGSKLVLETDGTEICDDEILLYYIKEKVTFIILADGQDFIYPMSIYLPSPNESSEEFNQSNVSTEHLDEVSKVLNETSTSAIKPSDKLTTENLNEISLLNEKSTYSENIAIYQSVISNSSTENLNAFSYVQSEYDDLTDEALVTVEKDIITPNSLINDCLTSQTVVTSASPESSQSALLFSKFDIPWEKIPTDINLLLERKQRLGKKMNCLANILVDELRLISFFIPMSVIRYVAQNIASRYPDSLIEKDKDNKIISSIPMSLITIMKNRNSFLNRAPKRVLMELETNVPVKERKKTNILKQTCANWQPQNISDNETFESLQSKKEYLQNMFAKEKITINEKTTIKTFMKDCFTVQRSFLNNRNAIPNINEIQKEWPFLFKKEIIFQHFQELMGSDISTLQNKFNQKRHIIFNVLNSTKKKTISIKEMSDDIDIIQNLFLYFNEDATFLFKIFGAGTTLDDIRNSSPTNTPWIAILQSINMHNDKYYLFIENQLIEQQKYENILELIAVALAYFYTFNMLYPKQVSQTLEFVIRYFLQYYSANVRGGKKHINNISKINNFISKLNSSE